MSERLDYEFDRAFEVLADGSTRVADSQVYVEVYAEVGESGDPYVSDGWEFASAGYTRQDLYNGPIMHNSEFMGGALLADTLGEPGVYVMEPVYWDDDTIEGWVLLRRTVGD